MSIKESIEVTIDGQVFEDIKHKYVPVSAVGAGCKDCHYAMAKVTGKTGKINATAMREWLAKGIKSISPNPRQGWIEIDPRVIQNYWR